MGKIQNFFETRKRLTTLIVVVVLVVGPLLSSNPYVIFVFTAAIFYAMVALSLDVIVGFAGFWHLAHATFLAIGGYAAGKLAKTYGLTLWIGIPAGAVVAGIVGVILGWFMQRLRKEYLMIATLNFAIIGQILMTNWVRLTGGTAGMAGVPPIEIPWLNITSGGIGLEFIGAVRPGQQYYIVLLGALLTFAIVRHLEYSPIGVSLRAMRDDDLAAQTMGHDILQLRLLAFGIGSALAGMAGGIFVTRFLSISPAAGSMENSVLYMVMVIVGGSGNPFGVMVGAALLSMLPELLRGLELYRLLVYGVIMLGMMLFRPQGLIPERIRKLEVPAESLKRINKMNKGQDKTGS